MPAVTQATRVTGGNANHYTIRASHYTIRASRLNIIRPL